MVIEAGLPFVEADSLVEVGLPVVEAGTVVGVELQLGVSREAGR